MLEKSLTVIWRNPKPSATLYCQPLRFKFEIESTNLIFIKEATLKDEISNIVETCVDLSNGKPISVRHTIQVTMIDGKFHTP